MKYEHLNFIIKIMKTQPRQYISNKYNTCSIVTSPVYIGSKIFWRCIHYQGDNSVEVVFAGLLKKVSTLHHENIPI